MQGYSIIPALNYTFCELRGKATDSYNTAFTPHQYDAMFPWSFYYGAAEVQTLSIQPLSQFISMSNLELHVHVCTNCTCSVASVQTEAQGTHVRMALSLSPPLVSLLHSCLPFPLSLFLPSSPLPVGSSPGDGPPVSLHWITLSPGQSLRRYQVASSGISIL